MDKENNHRHLLITGKPGIGKTTFIQNVVKYFSSWKVTGFWTTEVRKAGRRIGFDIIIVSGGHGVLARVENEPIKSPQYRVGKYRVSIRDLENLAVPTLYSKSDLLVIDEIGKMEIYSSRFREALVQALDQHPFVLATIGRQRLPFLQKIKERQDTDVWEITVDNRNQMLEQIMSYLKPRESK